MLDICTDQAADIDIVVNAKKSSLFAVGKLFDNIDNLYLGTDVISWSENLKYLGLSFKAGKTLTVDFANLLRNFYGAANSICSHTKYASEITKLFLVESYCLPLISYGCEALKLNSYQIHQLNVRWNNAYRRICITTVESVKNLQFYCGRLDFTHLYVKRKLNFFVHCLIWII